MNDNQLKSAATGCALLIFGAIGLLVFLPGTKSPTTANQQSDASANTPPKTVSMAEQRKAFATFNAQVFSLFSQCDNVGAPIEAAMKGGDIYGAYDAATTAYAVCIDTSDKVAAIAIPKVFPQAVQSKLHAALADCSTAYKLRADYYETAQQVLNGDVSPATAHVVKVQKILFNDQGIKCALEYVGAADSGGFSDIALSTAK